MSFPPKAELYGERGYRYEYVHGVVLSEKEWSRKESYLLGENLYRLHYALSHLKLCNEGHPPSVGIRDSKYFFRERLETLSNRTLSRIAGYRFQRLSALDRYLGGNQTWGLSPRQFIHGDIHLGNIVETDQGWNFIDFDRVHIRAHEYEIIRAAVLQAMHRNLCLSESIDKVWQAYQGQGATNASFNEALRYYYVVQLCDRTGFDTSRLLDNKFCAFLRERMQVMLRLEELYLGEIF